MKVYVKPNIRIIELTAYSETTAGFNVNNSVGYDENLAKPDYFEFEEENDNVIDATRFSIWEPQETNPDEE